jgi:hypothetical protein
VAVFAQPVVVVGGEKGLLTLVGVEEDGPHSRY